MTQPYQQYGAAPVSGEPAGLGGRFLARLVDGVVLLVASLILGSMLGGGLVATGSTGTDGPDLAVAVSTLVTVALQFTYFGVLDSAQGGTLGKKMLRLRVVAPDGHSNVSFAESAKRNVFFALSLVGLVPSLGLIASVVSLVALLVIAVQISLDTVRRQAWHDRFAGGTRVVKVG